MPDEPKAKAQVVITLYDNNTTNLQYSCDELLARGLIDKARSIIDLQGIQQMSAQAARIQPASNGDLKRIIQR